MSETGRSILPTLTRRAFAWSLFDFGYWACASATVQTILPILFKHKLVAQDHQAPVVWGWVVALSTLVGIFIAPIVGAVSDMTHRRKLLLGLFSVVAISGSVGFLADTGDWKTAAWFAGLALFGNMMVVSLYNSFLCFVADNDDEANQVSAWATSLGNLGPAILLTVLQFPHKGLADMTQEWLWFVFGIAALWWLVFTVPFFLYVPEKNEGSPEPVKFELSRAWDDLIVSFRIMAQNSDFCRFVFAIFVFNDSAAAMFHLSLIFGASLGITTSNLFGAVVLNRWLSVFMAIIWAYISRHLSARIGFLVVMVFLVAATFLAFFMTSALHFWILQVILGAAGTGSFIYCRTLLAAMTPSEKAGQHFGFLASVGNLAGFFGPAIYSSVGMITGRAKDGFVVLAVFVLGAMVLFSTVDFEKGKISYDYESIPDKKDDDAPNTSHTDTQQAV